MKKNRFLFILIAAAVIAGCTETKEKEYAPVEEDGYTLIQADIESLLFGGDDRVWPEGAAIGVYGSEQGENEPFVIKNAGVGLDQAGFYGPLVKGDIAAYFPYSPSYIGDVARMPFTLDPNQIYQEDPVGMFLDYTPTAFARMVDGKLRFSYPCGLLKITVESQSLVDVKQVGITSASSKLSGFGVFLQDGSIMMTESAEQYVMLDCGDDGIPAKTSDGSLNGFYMVVAPGVYDDLELSVYLEGADAPFTCAIPEIEVRKISASDFSMVTIGFRPSGGPAGFVEENMTFDE